MHWVLCIKSWQNFHEIQKSHFHDLNLIEYLEIYPKITISDLTFQRNELDMMTLMWCLSEKLQFLLLSTCSSEWIITQSFVWYILLWVGTDINLCAALVSPLIVSVSCDARTCIQTLRVYMGLILRVGGHLPRDRFSELWCTHIHTNPLCPHVAHSGVRRSDARASQKEKVRFEISLEWCTNIAWYF